MMMLNVVKCYSCFSSIVFFLNIIKNSICHPASCSVLFTETVCPARIPIDSRDEKGFDILLHLNLAKKAKNTKGTLYGSKAYQVTSRVDLSEATR